MPMTLEAGIARNAARSPVRPALRLAVLEAVRDLTIADCGRPPTLVQIAERVGLRTKDGASYHVARLLAAGALRQRSGSRGLEVTPLGTRILAGAT